MIIKLREEHRQEVLAFLYQEPSINILIIGDIENNGFDQTYQHVYAEYQNDVIHSVVLQYRQNIIYYCNQLAFNKEWLDIINEYDFSFISGKKELIDLIYPYYPTYREKPMYFCEAKTINFELDDTDIIEAKTKEDCEKMFALLHTIVEFDSMKNQTKEKFVTAKMNTLQHSKSYYVQKDNKCVSVVSTTADTTKSAMIVGVATDKDYRNLGYASLLMKRIMHEYIVKKGKYLCLFYDNPAAGKIYHKLGFKDIDMWQTLKKN